MTNDQRPPLAVIILAAGKGTRMASDKPKVLHALAGRPMLGHLLDLSHQLGAVRDVVVTGHGSSQVADYARRENPAVLTVEQKEQLGTGHAVMQAMSSLNGHSGDVLILYGDVPLLTAETVAAMRAALAGNTALVVLGFRTGAPGAYGRLILDDAGGLARIVEARDASDEELAVTLCNSGILLVRGDVLPGLLAALGDDNAQGEIYLTDCVEIARNQGLDCAVAECGRDEVLGINSRVELAEAEAILQTRLRERAMAEGATLADPSSVYFSMDTRLGRDVTVGPNVVFGPGVRVGDGVEIRPFCHIEGAKIASGARIGPFTRLRPGADLAEDAHIGNFVEIKNTRVEQGAKINHLSYIGDARVGAGANIGAGTITCNYDGFFKHHTDIGAGASIGSDTLLVAPVKVGDGAMTGSGTVITDDVPADALAITRPELVVKQGWAARYRAAMQKKKDSA